MDQSGPPTLMQGPYVPLSTSTPVHMPSDNNQYAEAVQDESSFRQVIPSIPQQSLYPSLPAMGSSPNTTLSPSIPLARRVTNEIEEHQRTVLDGYAEGMDRETNTSPVLSSDEQQVKTKNTLTGQQPADVNVEVPANNQYAEAMQDESSFWQVIPSIPQQSLYPSLPAMGSSPNAALSPSIPLARRVTNEIEEHQRTVLDGYAEGMDRETNTSPVLSSDEQQVKTKNTLTGQQPVDVNVEVQDNTLQLESPEKEDTSIKQVDSVDVQNQDVEEKNRITGHRYQ